MSTVQRVFSFLAHELESGAGAILVTVTDVTGASVRNPGAQLGVASDGRFVGSLSGGCIERAVVAEAQEVLAQGVPRRLAYGAGSSVIDIRLPCGGRVDLLFNPLRDKRAIDGLLAAHAARMPATLLLPTSAGEPRLVSQGHTGWSEDGFRVRHLPPLRLVIFGHGATPEALVALAKAMDIDTIVLTPDVDIVDRLRLSGGEVRLLSTPGAIDQLPPGDLWTAYVCLFHDHDWEDSLLASSLREPSLFVGAMGSRATHAARLAKLAAQGIGEADLARIVSPIGLVASSRDPESLALSALVQIVAEYNASAAPTLTLPFGDA